MPKISLINLVNVGAREVKDQERYRANFTDQLDLEPANFLIDEWELEVASSGSILGPSWLISLSKLVKSKQPQLDFWLVDE